jgi:uroporphyrinogen-III decarboxylase
MLKVEPVEAAVQRTLQTMMDWGDEHSANFAQYFDYVSLNKAVHDMLNGRVSPWLILNCTSGKTMVSKMSDEQLSMITPVFDVKFWMKKFKDSPADILMIQELCNETGIK